MVVVGGGRGAVVVGLLLALLHLLLLWLIHIVFSIHAWKPRKIKAIKTPYYNL